MMEVNEWGFLVFSEEHRRKMSEKAKGNQNGARPYPAFIHQKTGEIIPAGFNLAKMCRERGLIRTGMRYVKAGLQRQYKGWMLYEQG